MSNSHTSNSFNNRRSNTHNSNNNHYLTDKSYHASLNAVYYSAVDNRITVANDAVGLEILRQRAVMSASFDSLERQSVERCLPGTREVILDRIYKWVDSREDSAVFWLQGPAGSGKTTIATTVAEKYSKENRLAGSFFFSRDPAHNPDRLSLDGVIATIAYQNAKTRPGVRKQVVRRLSDPCIFEKSLRIQFDQLIIDPVRPRNLAWASCLRIHIQLTTIILHLRSHPWGLTLCNSSVQLFYVTLLTCTTPFILVVLIATLLTRNPSVQNIVRTSLETLLHPRPIIVVIDALDECRVASPVKSLIEIVIHEYQDTPPPIRFLLTSRPEEYIQAIFKLHPESFQRTCCTNLKEFGAHADIRKFFEHKFERLSGLLPIYGTNLEKPLSSAIDSLVIKSEGLFIYASTFTRLVGDVDPKDGVPLSGKLVENFPISPAERFESMKDQHNGLDGLYLQVLHEAPYARNPEFKRVLGALCFMHSNDPLSMRELAKFLRLNDSGSLCRWLMGCKSILQIPETDNGTITFFHASLHDFLTNSVRSGVLPDGFYIDPIAQHLSLLNDCFRIIINNCNKTPTNPAMPIVFEEYYMSNSSRYSWNNWHHHLFAVSQLTHGKVVDKFKEHIGEHEYESIFLPSLHHLGDIDQVPSWHLMWLYGRSISELKELENRISLLETELVGLSAQMSKIRNIVADSLMHLNFC